MLLTTSETLNVLSRLVRKKKGHVQATVCYTTSEFHTNEKFVKMAKQLEEIGADSICIKDMAGLLRPYVTYDLVKMMKEEVKILFNFILTTQAVRLQWFT